MVTGMYMKSLNNIVWNKHLVCEFFISMTQMTFLTPTHPYFYITNPKKKVEILKIGVVW